MKIYTFSFFLINIVLSEKELSPARNPIQDISLLGLPGRCWSNRKHGGMGGFLLYHHSLVLWRVIRRVIWAYFAESIEVHQADESLQAVCFKDSFGSLPAKNLPLEEIFLDDHNVPIVIPAHRCEGVIFHYHPKLSWEGEPKNGPVAFHIGSALVWSLWWWIVLGAWTFAHGFFAMGPLNLPGIHIWIRG